jgi:hypothetical protein
MKFPFKLCGLRSESRSVRWERCGFVRRTVGKDTRTQEGKESSQATTTNQKRRRKKTKIAFEFKFESTMSTIGIDFGGVLGKHDTPDTGEEHLNTFINVPLALDALQRLSSLGHRLVLISYAGKTRSQETLDSIRRTCPDLFDCIYFVRDKKFKRNVCEFAGCDVMIDDRADTLEMFAGSPTVPVLFGSASDTLLWMNDWSFDVTTVLPGAKVLPNASIDLSKMVHKLD